MEECEAVENQLDKVTSALGNIQTDTIAELTELITKFQGIKDQLRAHRENGGPGSRMDTGTGEDGDSAALVPPAVLQELRKTLKTLPSTVKKLRVSHREEHKTISKVGHAIDNGFEENVIMLPSKDTEVNGSANKENKTKLNEAVAEHLYKEGKTAVADTLVQEMGLPGPGPQMVIKKLAYQRVNQICGDLRNNTVHSAGAWAIENRESLLGLGSTLEFKLHRFVFIKILLNSYPPECRKREAMEYAQKHFHAIGERHAKEIQTLMGALLYSNHDGLLGTPSFSHYRRIFEYVNSADNWIDLYDSFRRDASTILGVPLDSQLETCVEAGCKLLPNRRTFVVRLMMRNAVMASRTLTAWKQRSPYLGIGVPFQNCNFHSVFVCPILRDPTSLKNPPVRLRCGHVISRDALYKLCINFRYVCPYCPGSRHIASAKPIRF